MISGCGDIFVLALFSFFFFFFFRSSAWFLGAPTHGYCSSNSSRRDSVAGPACVLFTRDMTQGVTYCLPPTKESFTSRQTLGRPRIPEPALHSFTWECMLPGGVPCVRRSSPPLQRYRCGKGGAGSKHSVWTYIHSSSEYVCGTGLDTGGGGGLSMSQALRQGDYQSLLSSSDTAVGLWCASTTLGFSSALA